MLCPAMNDLLKKVNNRYMLVNLTAKRARDIADEAEEAQTPLTEKPVKMALNDIMSGHIVLREHHADEQDADTAPAEPVHEAEPSDEETGETPVLDESAQESEQH